MKQTVRDIHAMSPEELLETENRLLREAAERYGGMLRAAREQRPAHVTIVITVSGGDRSPYLIPGAVYSAAPGYRGFRAEPCYYILFNGRAYPVKPEECVRLDDAAPRTAAEAPDGKKAYPGKEG